MDNQARATQTHIWDVQASEPYTGPDGQPVYRSYVNLRLHVLTDTMENAIALFKKHHPTCQLHQIIRRTAMQDVIVDPAVVERALS